MSENVKKELEKTIEQINKDFSYILDERLPDNEVIGLHFKGIRTLVNYCENLALNGEAAIEE